MTSNITLAKRVYEFLKQYPNQRFTNLEIAYQFFDIHPKYCDDKRGNSKRNFTDKGLINQIAGEINVIRKRIQGLYPQIKITDGGSPYKLYYTTQSDSEEVDSVETEGFQSDTESEQDTGGKITENCLYPKLSQYLSSEFALYSKRIDEKRSSNTRGPKGNEWLHPDMVAMENLSVDWHQEVKDCVGQYSDKKTKLWSFEVKLLLNQSNVRKCFFQTVSNSSWANFGYLVTHEITGEDTYKELRMLCSAHGIGLIHLNHSSPSDSQILIPAKERQEIDWDMANRLTSENTDFKEFITLIRQFYQTGDLRAADWDLCEP